MTDNPCDGKIAISVRASMDPITDYCVGGVKIPIVFVYVNANTPSVAQSYLAGNPIYSISDCTQCADDAGIYYQDTGTSDPNTYYYFKGCELFIRTCEDRQAVTVRTNVNRDFLCDGIGTTHTVYLDNDYTESLPFAGTGNNIYTTDGLYAAATGTATADVPSGYYSIPYTTIYDPENEDYPGQYDGPLYGNPLYTRFWTDAFGNEGGDFGTPQQCTEDPGPIVRYEHPVLYATTELRVCVRGINQTIWADASNFKNATTMWTSETGTGRPVDGFYTFALARVGGNKIFEFDNNVLTETGGICEGGEMPE